MPWTGRLLVGWPYLERFYCSMRTLSRELAPTEGRASLQGQIAAGHDRRWVFACGQGSQGQEACGSRAHSQRPPC